jgi:hypothetical protein
MKKWLIVPMALLLGFLGTAQALAATDPTIVVITATASGTQPNCSYTVAASIEDYPGLSDPNSLYVTFEGPGVDVQEMVVNGNGVIKSVTTAIPGTPSSYWARLYAGITVTLSVTGPSGYSGSCSPAPTPAPTSTPTPASAPAPTSTPPPALGGSNGSSGPSTPTPSTPTPTPTLSPGTSSPSPTSLVEKPASSSGPTTPSGGGEGLPIWLLILVGGCILVGSGLGAYLRGHHPQ